MWSMVIRVPRLTRISSPSRIRLWRQCWRRLRSAGLVSPWLLLVILMQTPWLSPLRPRLLLLVIQLTWKRPFLLAEDTSPPSPVPLIWMLVEGPDVILFSSAPMHLQPVNLVRSSQTDGSALIFLFSLFFALVPGIA